MKITANDIFTYTLVLIGILDLLISIIRLVIDTKKKYPSIFPKVSGYFLTVSEGGVTVYCRTPFAFYCSIRFTKSQLFYLALNHALITDNLSELRGRCLSE